MSEQPENEDLGRMMKNLVAGEIAARQGKDIEELIAERQKLAEIDRARERVAAKVDAVLEADQREEGEKLVSMPLVGLPRPAPERAPQAQCPIVGISITVTEDIPGGLPAGSGDFTAALLSIIKLACMHGGREIQLHHARQGWEREPHVPAESCACVPLVFRVEPASQIIIIRPR